VQTPVEPASHNVRALRGVCVLVAAGDVAFVRAATFLLLRRGFAVQSTTRPPEFLAAVEETAPDVVVLDATASVATAARTALAIEGLRPRTRVLFVSDHERPADGPFPVFAKWSSLEYLVAHIERLCGRPAPRPRPAP
jgi:two-component SAPR family response regulator